MAPKTTAQPTALVTGANRGIGLALCEALLADGYSVIGTCRRASAELKALGCRIEKLDVCKDNSVANLRKALGNTPLDLLLHNAGQMQRDDLERMDFAGIAAQFQTNAIGPLRLSRALRPLLKKGSKIVFITSRMGSISDNNAGRMYGYRMSKAALNMAGKGLSRDLAPDEIAVLMLHPGFVRTEMTEGRGHWSPAESATSMLRRIKELELSQSGAFWHADGTQLPW
jgi:NAD(P)-dependent dehydrogenase (short-subunit alcohol dehydrogenase family)